MFFTRVAKLLAHLMFWWSLLRICLGFFVALNTTDMTQNMAASARYLSAATSGEAINEGMIGLLLAVVLGVISEIGSHVRQIVSDQKIQFIKNDQDLG